MQVKLPVFMGRKLQDIKAIFKTELMKASQKRGRRKAIDNKNIEALNGVYRELAELIGINKTLRIYENFRGLQINFPTRLYDRDYVIAQAVKAAEKGESIRAIAVKYEYSERWIREMVMKKRQERKDLC